MGDKQTVPLIWGGVDDLREQLIRAHAEIVRMHDLADQQQAARRAAGDEIQRLRAEVERLKTELEGVMHRHAKWIKELHAEVERLEKELETWTCRPFFPRGE